MYTPARVVELVDQCDNPGLIVFWISLSEGSRDDFAAALIGVREHRFLVPIVMRAARFTDANAVMSDLARTILENKDKFDAARDAGCVGSVAILLIAKEELRLPQVSSPVDLPDWFPNGGGKTTYCRICDLGQTAEVVLLNAAEARTDDMADALFYLERALADRLATGDPASVEKLLKRATKSGGLSAGLLVTLQGHADHIKSVKSPRGYRPSVADGKGLAAQLILIILKTPSSEWSAVAHELADALQLDDFDDIGSNLLAILFRPIGKQRISVRNAHLIMLSVFGAYQFITGAAHAGEYPKLPATLIYSVSVDLRRSIRAATMIVESRP